MFTQIISVKPTTLEEFYINKDCIGDIAYTSSVDFEYKMGRAVKGVRTFTVESDYKVVDYQEVLLSQLRTKTEFSLKGITMNQESLQLLEQAVYIAYSEMLKHHKNKYKHWPVIAEDIVMPEDDHVMKDLNLLLVNLPY